MMVTISADDLRSIKAIEIAAGASGWLKCRLTDGTKAYGIPSQRSRGVYHLANAQECSCWDAQHHQAPCKHILAVRLHCELTKAERQRRASTTRHRRGSESTTPESQPNGARRPADRYVEIFGTD